MAALWTDDDITMLDLRNRRLAAIPGVGRCKRVDRVWLGGNRFTSFPAELADLPGLQIVSMHDNPLVEIGDDAAARMKLWSIDFSGTLLKTLPPSSSGWPVTSVRLMNMPADFAWDDVLGRLDPTRLHTLSIGENPALARLPASLARFQNLKLLHLNKCGISEIPAFFEVFEVLETLSFFENALTALPDVVAALPGLRSLVVSKNPGTRGIKAALRKRDVGYVVS